MKYEDAFIRASAHFLTEEFPKDCADWDENKIDQWVDEHRWEPMENAPIELILESIDLLARDFQSIT